MLLAGRCRRGHRRRGCAASTRTLRCAAEARAPVRPTGDPRNARARAGGGRPRRAHRGRHRGGAQRPRRVPAVLGGPVGESVSPAKPSASLVSRRLSVAPVRPMTLAISAWVPPRAQRTTTRTCQAAADEPAAAIVCSNARVTACAGRASCRPSGGPGGRDATGPDYDHRLTSNARASPPLAPGPSAATGTGASACRAAAPATAEGSRPVAVRKSWVKCAWSK